MAGDQGHGTLCKGFTACKNFQRDFPQGKGLCDGCHGDMRPLRAVSRACDSALDPIVNQVLKIEPERLMPLIESGVEQAQKDLAALTGTDCGVADTLVALLSRACQRVATMENEAKLAAYHSSK